MDHLQPPKYFTWHPQLSPAYTIDCDLLVTSGCSFTASTQQTASAASWPGYVKDRCGLQDCVDMSYPGAGNLYIRDSIIYAIDNLASNQKPFVVVMWSGLDRTENITEHQFSGPGLNGKFYNRYDSDNKQDHAKQNLQYMIELADYLQSKNIPYAFTFFVNLTEPPFLPVRDTTPRFTSKQHLEQLDTLNWVATGNSCLYEWAFFNDYLDQEDYFHPPVEANLRWTDEVLLPELAKQGYIDAI